MRIATTLVLAFAVLALAACEKKDKHEIEIKTEPGKIEIETNK